MQDWASTLDTHHEGKTGWSLQTLSGKLVWRVCSCRNPSLCPQSSLCPLSLQPSAWEADLYRPDEKLPCLPTSGWIKLKRKKAEDERDRKGGGYGSPKPGHGLQPKVKIMAQALSKPRKHPLCVHLQTLGISVHRPCPLPLYGVSRIVPFSNSSQVIQFDESFTSCQVPKCFSI